MEFPLEPLTTHVVVKRIFPESVTPGGIVIPEISRDHPTRGIVIAVGPGTRLDNGEVIPVSLEPGDIAIYPPLYGTEIVVGGVELTFLKEADVVAKEPAAS